MPKNQVSFRRLPSDDYYLTSIGEHYGIDNTAVFRIAIRDYAFKHGFGHPETHDMLLALRDMVAGCRIAKVQGMDKTIARAEKLLKRHAARLTQVYRFAEYPLDAEADILREERMVRQRAGKKRRK